MMIWRQPTKFSLLCPRCLQVFSSQDHYRHTWLIIYLYRIFFKTPHPPEEQLTFHRCVLLYPNIINRTERGGDKKINSEEIFCNYSSSKFYWIKNRITDDLMCKILYGQSHLKLSHNQNMVTFIDTSNQPSKITVTMMAAGGQLSQM